MVEKATAEIYTGNVDEETGEEVWESISFRYVSPRTWLKALKSKKYMRAVESMQEVGTAMCCLGVLCDVSGAPRELYDSWDTEIPVSQLPDWMTINHFKTLIRKNDAVLVDSYGLTQEEYDELKIKPTEYWDGTGVLEYIEKYCIPRYDKLKAEKEAKKK